MNLVQLFLTYEIYIFYVLVSFILLYLFRRNETNFYNLVLFLFYTFVTIWFYKYFFIKGYNTKEQEIFKLIADLYMLFSLGYFAIKKVMR